MSTSDAPVGALHDVPVAAQPAGFEMIVRYFLRLGALGFGGPIALAGYMQRDLVEARGWYTEQEYLQGLALAQTMPGRLAAQLAMWLGYIRRGWIGTLIVSIVFAGPAFLFVLAVAVIYAHYQGLSVVHELFYGIGPAAIAIITLAAMKLARTTNKRDPILWATAVILGVITALAGAEIAPLFIVAGLFGAVVYGGDLPHWLRSGTATVAPIPLLAGGITGGLALGGLVGLAAFFVEAGAFTFGSGLAIIPFMHHGVVDSHHWVTERQFLDAVAMGLISPEPVVIMSTFVGYLAGGVTVAIIATIAIFLPVFFFVVIPGRWFLKHQHNRRVTGFVTGATAAAGGAIAGATYVLARGTITGAKTILVYLVALAVLWRFKVHEPYVVICAGVAGLILA
jgi:chromate transporter